MVRTATLTHPNALRMHACLEHAIPLSHAGRAHGSPSTPCGQYASLTCTDRRRPSVAHSHPGGQVTLALVRKSHLQEVRKSHLHRSGTSRRASLNTSQTQSPPASLCGLTQALLNVRLSDAIMVMYYEEMDEAEAAAGLAGNAAEQLWLAERLALMRKRGAACHSIRRHTGDPHKVPPDIIYYLIRMRSMILIRF